MAQIKLKCECCNKVWDLPKTPELPEHIFFMRCNFCIDCNDRMTDYYKEWWDEGENDLEKHSIPVPDNQLCMPFIFDEIGIEKEFEGLVRYQKQ